MIITGRYNAKVTSADDPDQRGRIMVTCPDLLADTDENSVLPMWVEPAHDWGVFTIPNVDEQVEIEVVEHGSHDEISGQSSLEGLDVRWRGKRHYSTEATPPTPIHDDFKTNYGKRRGFATPFGHVLVFDDTEGSPEINLAWTGSDGKRSKLIIDKDGTVTLAVLDEQHKFVLNGVDKSLVVSLENEAQKMTLDNATPKLEVALANGQHKMTLDGTQLEVKLGGGATLKAEQNAGNATLTVGDGAKHVPIVEALKDFYTNQLKTELESIKTAINTHTHTVPSAGFNATAPGAPIAGSGTATPTSSGYNGTIPSWDSSIESSKVSIPDG